MTVFLLIRHAYNPLTSALSSYKTTLNTVPLTYYDYHGAYGGNDESHAGVSPTGASPRGRENATLVMLASNSEVNNVVRCVYELEDRFNSKYNYPWIFLNNEQFSDEFKSYASVLFSSSHYCPSSRILTGCPQPKSRVDSRVRACLLWADP